MSKREKLVSRLLSKPKDFEWSEAVSLLESMGFEILRGSGSRRKFRHKGTNTLIIVHKPHPGNLLKDYAIELIVDSLKEGGFIK
jgi:predicted RNA binding protein YcfA (HicA-like mRNA interferase family)